LVEVYAAGADLKIKIPRNFHRFAKNPERMGGMKTISKI